MRHASYIISFFVPANSQRANDLGFASLSVFFGDAKAIFLVQGEDKIHKLFIGDAGAKFAVEQIPGSLGQRSVVDIINGMMERLDVEERIFHLRGVILGRS